MFINFSKLIKKEFKASVCNFTSSIMTILYPKYLEIKNKYCICYSGVFNEFILQLAYLTNIIQEKFQIELYICCKDELKKLKILEIIKTLCFKVNLIKITLHM